MNQESFILSNPYHVKKVCISDPANVASLEKMIDLVAYARQVFPKAETIVVFHRGISADLYTDAQTAQVVQKAIKDSEDLGARCVDISYGADGFSIYDDCDIHIGFRVHAHIYNLSRRNLSILAEEDARGAGVNDALGLEHVTSYDYGIGISYEKECVVATVGKVSNIYFMQMLDDCLNNLYQTDFMQVKNAYKIMKKYHGIIEGHIKGLCKFL